MSRLSAAQARRIAIAAQGFTGRPAGPVNRAQLRRLIAKINVLQLDSVSVVVRAHYAPVFSRLGPYDRTVLDRPFLLEGELVARVDLKRDGDGLHVFGAFLEPGRDRHRVAAALVGELRAMAAWLGVGAVRIGERGDLSADLRRACAIDE